MKQEDLLLEVGTQALNDLSSDEKNAILNKYEEGQETMAGLKVFSILMKKFQADYRMGRMYEDLSQKYEAYRNLYFQYAKGTKAGKSSINEETYDVERSKFIKPTRDANQ